MVKHLAKVKDSLFHMIVFATLAVVLGWGIPYVYYNYIDATKYFQINSAKVEGSYRACEKVVFTIDRNSLITTEMQASLALLKQNDGGIVYSHSEFKIPVSAGHKTIQDSTLRIPCDVPEGKYFIRGLASFKVDRVEKKEYFETNAFPVAKELHEESWQKDQ